MSRLQPLVSCKMFLDFAPPRGSRPRPRLLTELLWSLDLPAMTPLAYWRKQASLSIQNNVADRNKQWVALVKLALGCSSLTREMFSSVMTVVRIRKRLAWEQWCLALSQLEQCQHGQVFILDMKLSDAV